MRREFAKTTLHGKPWTVRAYTIGVGRWRLCCGSCHHKSCKWAGVAFYDAGEKMLKPFQFKSRKTHGDLKLALKSGGKRKHLSQGFTVQETLHYHGALNTEEFHSFVESHFEHKPLDEKLLVRCHSRKRVKRGLTCVSSCSTHEHEDSKPCKWYGSAQIRKAPVYHPFWE